MQQWNIQWLTNSTTKKCHLGKAKHSCLRYGHMCFALHRDGGVNGYLAACNKAAPWEDLSVWKQWTGQEPEPATNAQLQLSVWESYSPASNTLWSCTLGHPWARHRSPLNRTGIVPARFNNSRSMPSLKTKNKGKNWVIFRAGEETWSNWGVND